MTRHLETVLTKPAPKPNAPSDKAITRYLMRSHREDFLKLAAEGGEVEVPPPIDESTAAVLRFLLRKARQVAKISGELVHDGTATAGVEAVDSEFTQTMKDLVQLIWGDQSQGVFGNEKDVEKPASEESDPNAPVTIAATPMSTEGRTEPSNLHAGAAAQLRRQGFPIHQK